MPRFDDDDDLDRDWNPSDDVDEDPVDADEAGEPTIPCPACGEEIYEDADACPYCGEYLSLDDPAPSRPIWFWLALVACLSVLLWGVIVAVMLLLAA